MSYQLLVHLAREHHLDYVHGLCVGISQTVDELALYAYSLQHIIYLGAAAVYQHDLHAYQRQQHYIAHDRILEELIGHGIAAVLYHDDLVIVFLYVRERIYQHFRTDIIWYGHCFVCSFFVLRDKRQGTRDATAGAVAKDKTVKFSI